MKEVINSCIELGDKIIEQEKEIERLNKIANALEKELIDTYEFETGDTTHIKEVIKQIKEEI